MKESKKVGIHRLRVLDDIVREFELINKNASEPMSNALKEDIALAKNTLTMLNDRASLIRNIIEEYKVPFEEELKLEATEIIDTGVTSDEACNWGNHEQHLVHKRIMNEVYDFFYSIDMANC